jgi:hypothetical protein
MRLYDILLSFESDERQNSAENKTAFCEICSASYDFSSVIAGINILSGYVR